MKIEVKYKNYARLFFAYIIFTQFFVFYVVRSEELKPGLREMGVDYSAFVLVMLLLLINKFILYVRQTRDRNFGFSFLDETTIYHKPNGFLKLLGLLKSFVGTFFYSLFFVSLITSILELLSRDNQTMLFLLLKVLQMSFPVLLIAWDFKRLRFIPGVLKERRQEELDYAENMESLSNVKKASKERGTITGYEPRKLEKVDLVSNPLMRGEPGAGLSGSGFSRSNIKSGALGELNFAKVLQMNNLLQQFASYWSVQYPMHRMPGADARSHGDIDSVLIGKKHVYLIDLKLYKQGNLTWKTVKNENKVVAVDNITGDWIGKPYTMSRNMYHATKRIQDKFDNLGINMKVKSYVVMMPTDRGMGEVEDVFWPGDIECMTLPDFLKILEKEKPFDVYAVDAKLLDSVFTWLIKDESGSAPRYI